MKISQQIILPAVVISSILAGGIYGLIKKNVAPADSNGERLQLHDIPENGVQTDEFSFRLFQQALNEKKGNVTVAPNTVSNALTTLSQVAGGKTLEDLKKLQTKATPDILYSAAPAQTHLIVADINLPRTGQGRDIMALPFSENIPMAISIFNGALAQAGPQADAQFVTSEMVSPRTKLLAGAVSYFNSQWHVPFHAADSRPAEFDSSTGALPTVHQMRSRGLYRTIQQEGATESAVAMMMRTASGKESPLALIAILPQGDARAYAQSLTLQKLSSIRQALAQAPRKDTLVEFPRLIIEQPAVDMRYTLRRLGLASLFDSDSADFSVLSPEHVHLGAFVHAHGLQLKESPGEQAKRTDLEDAENTISFSRPFIWLLADLTTDTPIYFIGLVEEM